MSINNLENRQRGHGDKVKRFSLGELTSIIIDKPVKVAPEHSGCAILINRDYRSTFGDLEIFEITRGIWQKKLKTITLNYLIISNPMTSTEYRKPWKTRYKPIQKDYY